MADAHKKARDADRDAAIEVVEAAFADGQISRPDYDLRTDRVLRAETVGELQMLVQDLQVTADVAPVAKPTRSTPSVSPTGVKVVLAAVAAVIALGLVVPLVLMARVDSAQEATSAEPVPLVEAIDLTTARGYNRVVREVEAKTGSTTVFNAVIYPGYAVIEVPVDDLSRRSYGWYYNGEWDEWTGKGRADEDRFELDEVSGRTVGSLVSEARGLVEDPNTSYVIVNSSGREEGVCLSVYASNEHSETAYLDARCDGTVVRTYVS